MLHSIRRNYNSLEGTLLLPEVPRASHSFLPSFLLKERSPGLCR